MAKGCVPMASDIFGCLSDRACTSVALRTWDLLKVLTQVASHTSFLPRGKGDVAWLASVSPVEATWLKDSHHTSRGQTSVENVV